MLPLCATWLVRGARFAPSVLPRLTYGTALLLLAAFFAHALLAPALHAQYCGLINASALSSNRPIPPAAVPGISDALGRQQSLFQIASRDGSLQADNSAMHVDFTPAQVDFTVRGRLWSMSLKAYGRGSELQSLLPVAPIRSANRVEFHRGALNEWYANGPLGIEQGFTLTERPAGSPLDPLTLTLALSGELSASVDPGARGLTLADHDTPLLRYAGLTVTDAAGKDLTASLEVSRGQLSIRVDDSRAQYPLVIDPFAEVVKFTACDGSPGDRLGWSVSTTGDGTTFVTGADYWTTLDGVCGELGCSAGAAYVFLRPSTRPVITFLQTAAVAKLIASDPSSGALFGYSSAVSSDGSTIVIGSPGGWVGSNGLQGAAYVFVKPSTGWTRGPRSVLTETAKLTASDGRAFDQLGYSVSISSDGGTIATGAFATEGTNVNQGAVYVFVRPTAGWASAPQTAKLTTSGTSSPSFLGYSVAISADGETVVSGALGPFATPGAAYVFIEPVARLVNQTRAKPGIVTPPIFQQRAWRNTTQTAILTASDGVADDRLGVTVAISSDGATIAAGADATVGSNSAQGAVYVFTRSGSNWANSSQAAKLTASDGALQDGLGLALGLSGDGATVAAGAPYANIGANSVQGAVYVFTKGSGAWVSSTQAEKLFDSNGAGGDGFGYSTNINDNGSVILAGTPGSNDQTGAMYLYTGSAPSGPLLSATTLNFTSPVGVRTPAQSVTLTNRDTAPLELTSVSVTGACKDSNSCTFPFTSTRNCLAASPLAPGAQCTETVSFAPTSAGSFSASLAFTYDSGSATAVQSVELQGATVSARLPRRGQLSKSH